MIIEYRRDLESFKLWAVAQDWELLEIKDYSEDDGTSLLTYVVPNGMHMTVRAKGNIVEKVTPWDGSQSGLI